MNQKNELVSSDYCLVYSCVIKYQSILLDRRRTKSIHCLINTNESTIQSKEENLNKTELKRSNSSHLNQSSDCSCCAIHFTSGLEKDLEKLKNFNRLTNRRRFFSKTNQKLSQNLSSSSYSTNQSSYFLSNLFSSTVRESLICFDQQILDSSKTASTSTINSKQLKSTGQRLSSSSAGHRMPNNDNFKNANQQFSSTTDKINENVQQSVGVNQTSTNQTKTQPTRITDQDAIQLLAEDVESRLEALLRTFIQEEKLRQEHRYNSLMGKRSASLSALNSDYNDTDSIQDALNRNEYLVSSSPSYNQQLTSNKQSNNLGYVKPQQHRMQQSYQLHNSQNVNNQQQKSTALKTSHRLDSSPSRSSELQNNRLQSSKVTARSPSPTGRSKSGQNINSSNIIPVNRNNLFGQHTRSDQINQNKTQTSTNKPVTTNYLNLHQRSSLSNKDSQQQKILKTHPQQSSQQSNKQYSTQSNNNNLISNRNQFPGHSSHHRLYSPSNRLAYDPFSGHSSQFLGRSKDDSHIRRVVVYNLNKDVASVEKKPVIIIEGSKSMNGTLNNNFNTQKNVTTTVTGEKIGTNLNDNQSIRLRSAKTRANSPSRVGMMNGTANNNKIQQQNNTSTSNRIQNSPANTPTNKSSSSGTNSSLMVGNISSNSTASKKLSSLNSTSNKLIATNRLTTGHENSLQLKDQNNNLDHVGVSGSAAQLNTAERKVVRKVIVKELDGPNSSNNLTNKQQTVTYQQQQRLSPILNGDLNRGDAPKMATLNTQQQPISTNNNQAISSLDVLLSERDRILNNRDQYKQLRNNVLLSASSDANNNYILSKTKNDLTPSLLSTNSSLAAGLLSNNQSTNRNLPLSSSSSSSLSSFSNSAKRKPLIDRYSPFSIVNEARQRFEETVNKNGMNDSLSCCRFNLDHSLNKNDDVDFLNDDFIFGECYEQSDEEIVDSSMILIRSRLSSMLKTNGNLPDLEPSNLPNSTIISLLNHLSEINNNENQHEKLSLPACLADLNKNDLIKPQKLSLDNNPTTFDKNLSLKPQLDLPNLSTPNAFNSMRPPFVLTNPSDSMQSNN